MRKPIIGLVGPSGAGKSTLAKALVLSNPERYGYLPGFMTRPAREGEDLALSNLMVVSERVGRRLRASPNTIQSVEVNGVIYGNSRVPVNRLLEIQIGVKELLVDGVHNFRRAGYEVIVVLVVPIGHVTRTGREETDRKEALRYEELGEVDFSLVTDHRDPNGAERALNDLVAFLKNRCPA